MYAVSPANLLSGADLAFFLWSTSQTVQIRPRACAWWDVSFMFRNDFKDMM